MMEKFTKTATLLAVCFIFLLVASGCKSTAETEVDKLVKPVYVAAISKTKTVVLRGATGKVVVLPTGYYMGEAVADSLKVGDIFIPKSTNN
jgi:hypothetical protein